MKKIKSLNILITLSSLTILESGKVAFVNDSYKEPVNNAVVKLIEISHEHGREERKPVSHTFTNEAGEFVFGPLCPNKFYEIKIWVNQVKHIKICAKCKHEGKCLKGSKMDKCDYIIESNPDCCPIPKPEHKPDCKPHYEFDA